MAAMKVFFILQSFITPSYGLFRIIGGHNVKIEDFPYQLSLRKNGSHICGAALISDVYALSAAHCFRTPGAYSIRAGSSDRFKGGTIVYVKNAILHPERVYNRFGYDIAILELARPLTLSDKIQPIQLPKDGRILVPGIKGIISGFGLINGNSNVGSRFLRAAEVLVQNKNLCRLNYEPYGLSLNSLVFCAGGRGGDQDSCQGDSGGPLVIDNMLYGLVSFGLDCGDSEHPGVYINIPQFREFININTGI